jgi:hypothetical protein
VVHEGSQRALVRISGVVSAQHGMNAQDAAAGGRARVCDAVACSPSPLGPRACWRGPAGPDPPRPASSEHPGTRRRSLGHQPPVGNGPAPPAPSLRSPSTETGSGTRRYDRWSSRAGARVGGNVALAKRRTRSDAPPARTRLLRGQSGRASSQPPPPPVRAETRGARRVGGVCCCEPGLREPSPAQGDQMTPGAQYCTGIGQRKVHHLPGW